MKLSQFLVSGHREQWRVRGMPDPKVEEKLGLKRWAFLTFLCLQWERNIPTGIFSSHPSSRIPWTTLMGFIGRKVGFIAGAEIMKRNNTRFAMTRTRCLLWPAAAPPLAVKRLPVGIQDLTAAPFQPS